MNSTEKSRRSHCREGVMAPSFREPRSAAHSTSWIGHIVEKAFSFIESFPCTIPDAEAAVDKEWEKLEKLLAWQMTKAKEQQGGHSGSTKRAKNSSCCDDDGYLSSQDFGVRATVSAIQRPGCTPR